MSISTDINLLIMVDATQYTEHTESACGLSGGQFKWAVGNGDSEYVGGIISKFGNISRSVDISETGGINTTNNLDFCIQSSVGFLQIVETFKIKITGCPVYVLLLKDGVTSALYSGFISAYSVDEVEINISSDGSAIIPSGYIGTKIITESEYPLASDDVVGSYVPVVLGAVQYSPAINITGKALPLDGPFPFNVASDNYEESLTYDLLFASEYGSDPLGYATGDVVAFVDLNGAPSTVHSIVELTSNGVKITGKLPANYSEHEFINPWPAASLLTAWWVKVERKGIDIIASSGSMATPETIAYQDEVSTYRDAETSFARKYGSSSGVSVDGGANVTDYGTQKISGIPVSYLFQNVTERPAKETTPFFPVSGFKGDSDFPFDAYETVYPSSGESLCLDRLYDTGTIFDYDGAFDEGLTFGPFTAVDFPTTESDIYHAFDIDQYSAGHWDVVRDLVVSKIKVSTATNERYNLVVNDLRTAPIKGEVLSTVPKEYYVSDNTKAEDTTCIIWFDEEKKVAFKIPTEVITGLKAGVYTEIFVEYVFEPDPADIIAGLHPARIISVLGQSWVYAVDSTADAKYYVSTLGEKTYGSATLTIAGAIDHFIAYSYRPQGDVGAFTNGIGRAITEKTKTYDVLNSICNQSFICGFIGKLNMVLTFKDWLYDVENGEAPVWAFNTSNIIRDSINGYMTEQSNKVYNAFSCAYDYNYASDKYEKRMAIVKPDASIPEITGAWDEYVQGIGTGADTVAYSEALQAHLYVEEGYLATHDINTYAESESELSWYVDPSWASTETIQKYDLSAWKYLKRCAYWLSTPKRSVTFNIPLSYSDVDLLDYCTFTDPIYTNDITLYGWITSISIDLEYITISMTIGRDAPDSPTIREVGIQTIAVDKIIERGTQSPADDRIIEEGV